MLAFLFRINPLSMGCIVEVLQIASEGVRKAVDGMQYLGNFAEQPDIVFGWLKP